MDVVDLPAAFAPAVVVRGKQVPLEQSDIEVVRVLRDDGTETRVFSKVVDVAVLRQRVAKPDAKWRVSVRSFQNEYLFYSTLLALDVQDDMASKGIVMPKLLHCATRTSDSDEFGYAFHMVMSYLPSTEWEHRQRFDAVDAVAAIEYIARFHAYFWEEAREGDSADGTGSCSGGVSRFGGLKSSLFAMGGWWRKELRAAVAFDTLPDVVARLCEVFPAEFATLAGAETRGVMAAIAAARDDVTRILRNGLASRHTLIHGDLKTCNMMLRKRPGVGVGVGWCPGPCDVAGIDFQWVGRSASGCGDLTYLLCGAVEYDVLSGGVEGLKTVYYNALTGALAAAGQPAYARERFEDDYCLEVLDLFTSAAPQYWPAMTADVAASYRDRFGWWSFLWDARVMAWMCATAVECFAALRARGVLS